MWCDAMISFKAEEKASLKNVFYEEFLNLFRLATVVQADTEPQEPSDAVYLFGNTPDNEISILDKALKLWRSGKAPLILVCGGGVYAPHGVNAYNGGDAWEKFLTEGGVDQKAIIQLPRPELSHTDTEARALVHYAKDKGWKTIYITCCPMHQLRGFVNTVTYAVRYYPELRVHNAPGLSQPWQEEVVMSQANVHGGRLAEGIENEFLRLNRWHAKGDLLSCREVLKYLKWRDS